MFPKANTYVKGYGGHNKWIYFLIEDDDLLKIITSFGIKSALISKKNLITILSTIKIF